MWDDILFFVFVQIATFSSASDARKSLGFKNLYLIIQFLVSLTKNLERKVRLGRIQTISYSRVWRIRSSHSPSKSPSHYWVAFFSRACCGFLALERSFPLSSYPLPPPRVTQTPPPRPSNWPKYMGIGAKRLCGPLERSKQGVWKSSRRGFTSRCRWGTFAK